MNVTIISTHKLKITFIPRLQKKDVINRMIVWWIDCEIQIDSRTSVKHINQVFNHKLELASTKHPDHSNQFHIG